MNNGWKRARMTVLVCLYCGNIDKPEDIEYTGKCWHCGSAYRGEGQ